MLQIFKKIFVDKFFAQSEPYGWVTQEVRNQKNKIKIIIGVLYFTLNRQNFLLLYICIYGYALSRVIHRIQSEIIFRVNPNLYTAWLSFGPENPPPPLLLAIFGNIQNCWPIIPFSSPQIKSISYSLPLLTVKGRIVGL